MKTLFHNINITAIACAVPNKIVKISELDLGYSEQKLIRLIQSTGINEVRICKSNETVLDLAFDAVKKLIIDINIDIAQVDGLIFVTQTPDHKLPNNSAILQGLLGLQEDCVCIDINAGCSGYIQGLYQAGLMLSSGGCKKILLLCGDNISKFIDKDDPSISVLFGDGLSVTLIEEGKSHLYIDLKTNGGRSDLLKIPSGESRDLLGLNKNLNMDGFGVLSFALSKIPRMVDTIIDDIKKLNLPIPTGLICHQANKILNEALARKLKFKTNMPNFLAGYYGNTGSASIPLYMVEYIHRHKGSLEGTLLCGFGVGLTWGGAIVDLTHTNIFKLQQL